ncbi:hypothetical protein NsoK4_05510 [Nitrosopumilus sp. K4]|uniref:hypothetical protein n=1 Tax=Nitrosopumilus sp. K4 TaxID=2795383 RepID=UPI001BA6EFEF|nr:hypothetical protein [Nitrosopumilus sp. K4]QUC63922.1 hypothetical protein NsoK4_05510 [Nitrosopumilus sp. K4]
MSEYETNPLENFLFGIKSPITKDRYQRRLADFFAFMKIHGDLTEQSKHFMMISNEKGKQWIFATVMKFLTFHKERAETVRDICLQYKIEFNDRFGCVTIWFHVLNQNQLFF